MENSGVAEETCAAKLGSAVNKRVLNAAVASSAARRVAASGMRSRMVVKSDDGAIAKKRVKVAKYVTTAICVC